MVRSSWFVSVSVSSHVTVQQSHVGYSAYYITTLCLTRSAAAVSASDHITFIIAGDSFDQSTELVNSLLSSHLPRNLPIMYQSTPSEPRNFRSPTRLVRREVEKDTIWLIVFSTTALVIIFAGILYRWRTTGKNRARRGLDV